MDFLQIVPHLNASLNALSGLFIIVGFYFIKKRNIDAHRFCMTSACLVSAIFLISYVAHHAVRSYYFGIGPTRFTGEGIARPIYFTILTSHTILAALIAPFVIVTFFRGFKRMDEKHRKMARYVFPIWLYVSVTGVIVYIMLYHLFPAR